MNSFVTVLSMKYSILDLQNTAAKRGGECLTLTYHTASTRYEWRCDTCNNEWKATWNAVNNQKSWCPKCSAKNAAKKRWTPIEELQEYARAKGGQLVSPTYTTTKSKVKWECSEGHQWLAKWEKIKIGQWCPKCARAKKNFKYDLQQIQEIAKQYGGECISEEYKGVLEPLLFKCANGHTFHRQPALLTKSNPLQNTWCPKCKGFYQAEELCRNIFEIGFNSEFPNVYPGEWLTNRDGRKLQLDGYNADLKIAFEFQGKQHSQVIPFFNMDEDGLQKRKKIDLLKKQICNKQGIKLIIIEEFSDRHGLTTHRIIDHVKSACDRENLKLPYVPEAELEKRNRFLFKSQIDYLEKIAKQRGGKLISRTYLGSNHKYTWQCSVCEYKWKSTSSSVVNQGTWCPKCAGTIGPSISDLKLLAKSRGGKLLSNNNKGSKIKLKWECGSCHNTWFALYSNIQKGNWCPKCAPTTQQNKLISELIEYFAKNGEQLLTKYPFDAKKVQVKCKVGHIWHDTSDRIKRLKLKCPECKKIKKQREYQKKLESIIQEKNANLKGEYLNSQNKVKIICKREHVWMAKPASIFMGKWCPDCVKEEKRIANENKLRKIVAERGGKLLSKYTNAKTKVTINCGMTGHNWNVTPDSIQQGSWCPECNGGVKLEK